MLPLTVGCFCSFQDVTAITFAQWPPPSLHHAYLPRWSVEWSVVSRPWLPLTVALGTDLEEVASAAGPGG